MLSALAKHLALNVNCNWQDAAGDIDYFLMRRSLPARYVDHCRILRNNVTSLDKKPAPRLSETAYAFIQENEQQIQEMLDNAFTDPNRLRYKYFATQTYRKQYSLKVRDPAYDMEHERMNEGVPMELPEHVCMREAVQNGDRDMAAVRETFEALRQHYYTHASPTMFNSATPRPQTASCFLFKMMEDSIEGIFETLKRCGKVSQCGGGLGIDMQPIRNTGSEISSGGVSNGLILMLRMFNDMVKYVSQGSNRRGAGAVFVQVYNKDLLGVMEMRLPVGNEDERCRELFSAVVINKLFVQRVKTGKQWTLFCVTDVPKLQGLVGDAFVKQYEEYEADYMKYGGVQVPALRIVGWVQKSQDETGTPYVLNRKAMSCSQHRGLFGPGTGVESSNLCVEVMQFCGWNTDNKEGEEPQYHTAVCNLATVKLDRFLKPTYAHLNTGGASSPVPDSADDNAFSDTALYFDFEHFFSIVRLATRNTNATIDSMFYPTDCTERANKSCRPIGIGVQALADVFIRLGLPFCSEEAIQLGADISACMYYAALVESCAMAEKDGPYPRYESSPAFVESKPFQFDLFGKTEEAMALADRGGGVNGRVTREQWTQLRSRISEHGLRNSLLIAHPPTASTSQILDSIEAFEPLYCLIGSRKTSAGTFTTMSKYFHYALDKYGLLSKEAIDLFIKDGNLSRIPLPAKVKEVLKSAFDMKMKDYLRHAVWRQLFTDQGMSLNVFFRDPSIKKTVALWDFGMKHDLKTISYYIRRRPVVETAQFAGINDQRANEIAARLEARARQQTQTIADKSSIHMAMDRDSSDSGGGSDESSDETSEQTETVEQESGGTGELTSTGVSDFNFDFSEPAADEECLMCGS